MDMGMRCYDARLGRMFHIDPRAGEYPWQTTYAYHRNNPVAIVDFLGGGEKEDKVSKRKVEKFEKKINKIREKGGESAVNNFF